MTEQYIEHKLKTASDAARDFLAWNSIRAESRLRNSPHLRLQKDIDGFKDMMKDLIECNDTSDISFKGVEEFWRTQKS